MLAVFDDDNQEAIWDAVERIVAAYEQGYHEGSTARLTDYISAYDNRTSDNDDRLASETSDGLRRLALLELVKVDLELRWRDQCGWKLSQYVEVYPELGELSDLPADLVFEAFQVERQFGEAFDIESFCVDFPRQRKAVRKLDRLISHSASRTKQGPPGGIAVGQVLGDFELRHQLGSGGFAHVFLAHQQSLGREVALKVSANRGHEGSTMASLEHDHIVQVFSEDVDAETDLRLLCMQYVPGTTLAQVLRRLKTHRQAADAKGAIPSGSQFVRAIDALASGPAQLQIASLRRRELMRNADGVEAVCMIGAALADALEYAHRRGILHRDVKPDNILLSQFGRPLLADFNLSFNPTQGSANEFGGSLAYMSPEHLAAFERNDELAEDDVDHRADIYSLGAVLFECVALQRPFIDSDSSTAAVNQTDHDQRLPPAGMLAALTPSVSPSLDEIIVRCLQPDPNARYQSAADLQQALSAAEQLQAMRRAIPAQSSFLAWCARRPIVALMVAAILPNLLGSIVNIVYNLTFIVPQLSKVQRDVFEGALIAYNVIVYPLCIVLMCWHARAFLRFHWRDKAAEPAKRDVARSSVVRLPVLSVAVASFGWLPGGLVFPAAIHWLAEPLSVGLFAHFAADFAISGLIASTYLYFGVQSLTVRAFYLPLLVGTKQPGAVANRELRHVTSRLRLAQIGSGVIPLCGALLLVFLGPTDWESDWLFRALVLTLIGLGMLGFSLSVSFANTLQATVEAICGYGFADRRSRSS